MQQLVFLLGFLQLFFGSETVSDKRIARARIESCGG
ncbi:hypothetical protein X975_19827, partial [Stegodyphus mimosarum]